MHDTKLINYLLKFKAAVEFGAFILKGPEACLPFEASVTEPEVVAVFPENKRQSLTVTAAQLSVSETLYVFGLCQREDSRYRACNGFYIRSGDETPSVSFSRS